MSKRVFAFRDRLLAIVLTVLMIVAMLPAGTLQVAAEEGPSVVTTNIGSVTFYKGVPTEFQVTTAANGDVGKWVLGTFVFSDASAIEKLEYKESRNGQWYEFYGDFGPAGTGIQMADATSTFRVTFNKTGNYTAKISMVTADAERTELCSVSPSITVEPSEAVTTNISSQKFVEGVATEFTVTTTRKSDAQIMVFGTFDFADSSVIEKLEYKESQNGQWYEFTGDFGPAGTGFPLVDDATSTFRVTFNKAGSYNTKIAIVTADANREEVCSVSKDIVVEPSETVTTNISSRKLVVGTPTEFTVTTTAHMKEGTMVLGTFEFSDMTAVEKLEYKESQNGQWYEFTGDFGPAGTGFPLTNNATSTFRVTFNKAGNFEAKISMVTADQARTEVCSVTEPVAVLDMGVLTTNIGEKQFVAGTATEFGFTIAANGHAGENVFGSFEFSDTSAIEKLEYREPEDGQWYELQGDFGPAGTGFPMRDATSYFRVTFSKSGTYQVTAYIKRAADGVILCSSEEQTIIVEKAEQTGLEFADMSPRDVAITDDSFTNEAAGGQGIGDITYEITAGEEFASIDENTGEVTFVKIGTITVTATRAADEKYKEISASYNLTIVKALQDEFAFETSAPSAIFYEENLTYTNIASGGGGNGNITYEITAGGAYASIDEQTGELTINKVGTITVTATKEPDDKYNEATAEYTLEIKEAIPEFTAPTAEQLIYNGEEQTLANAGVTEDGIFEYSTLKEGDYTTVIPKGKNAGGYSVWFKIIGKENYADTEPVEIPVIIDRKSIAGAVITLSSELIYNGNEQVQGIATAVIDNLNITYDVVLNSDTVIEAGEHTLKIEGTGNFKDQATQKFTVKYLPAPENPYKVDPLPNTYGWNNTNVKIEPASGYSISTSLQGTYSDSITVQESTDENFKVYLKNIESGYITDGIAVEKINIDKVKPTINCITVQDSWWRELVNTITFGLFFNSTKEISIGASNEGGSDIAKIEYLIYSGTEATAKTTQELDAVAWTEEYDDSNKPCVDADNQYVIYVKITDEADNYDYFTSDGFIRDIVAPGITVSYDNNDVANGKYYKAPRTAKIAVTETNFTQKDVDDGRLVVTVTKDGINLNAEPEFEFNQASGAYEATVDFNEEGDYTFDIRYTDRAGNEYDDYTEDVFVIDTTDPQISISYDNVEAVNANYFKAPRTATVTVIEHNFEATGFAVESLVDGVDCSAEYLKLLREANWEKSTNDTDTYTAEISFDGNAKYEFIITYSDLAGRQQTKKIQDSFTVDKSVMNAPKVEYSEPVFSTFISTILKNVLFGFYKEPVTVTVTAESDCSGVDYFTYSYGVQPGASETNVGKEDTVIEKKDITFSDDGKTAKASFQIPAQFRGTVSVKATSMAGVDSEQFTDEACIAVVDNVAPGISVKYDAAEAKNDNYYETGRTATISIHEANFFAQDMIDKVPGTDEEHLVITVGKCLNNEQEFTETKVRPTFTKNGDIYTATVAFNEEADYTFDIKYTDRSGNVFDSYEKDEFTVDMTAPVLSIAYDQKEAINNSYYKTDRIAKVTIVEHNFRPSDIVVDSITAKNLLGEAVDLGKDYQQLLRTGNWTDNGDTHTLEIPFDVDAGYAFSISYSDLAGRAAKQPITDAFCIDKVAPDKLTVSYDVSVLDTILQAVTFGFYQANVKVTITAEDLTSGVDYFTYSYAVQEGASGINVGKTDTVITNQDAAFSRQGEKAIATFTIPIQFRGCVTFKATDMAGNASPLFTDSKNIVADNISPVISVKYDNLDAVNTNYFKAGRTATITIEEANFFAEDMTDKLPGTDEEYLVITVGKRLNDEKEFTETKVRPTFTKDGDTYTATVEFNEDADYTFDIKYTDRSGNENDSYVKDEFTVDLTAPKISIAYDNNDAMNTNYYNADRTATVTVVEHNFRASDIVVESITAKNLAGEDVDYGKDYQQLLRSGNWTADGDTHTLKIPFDVDATYSFTISYSDLANNAQTDKITEVFTVDKVSPTAFIKVDDWTASTDGTVWEKLMDSISFELWTQTTAKVQSSSKDTVSGIDYVAYFLSAEPLTQAQVKEATSWQKLDGKDSFAFEVEPDERFIVYARVVDKAGNELYLSSSGIIVDETKPDVEQIAPEVTVTPVVQPVNDLYSTDVLMDVTVKDPADAGDPSVYSGLKLVTYEVYNNPISTTEPTQTGTLFDFSQTDLSKDAHGLIQVYKQNASIKVDKQMNNSNDVVVKITATDNAGNVTVKTCSVKIDVTAPVISIRYDNNNADSASYFRANRTATVAITERNFEPDKVKVTITSTDGTIPQISEFVKSDGTGNEDNTVWTATINYTADGDYTFEIEYADAASNKCAAAAFADGTVAGSKFTIDKTKPTLSVTYNNNNALNGNYYKAERTATIVITEHNFIANRVKINLTATDDGANAALPRVSGWTTNGDRNTATIHYASDAKYTFDIDFTDMAGNTTADFAPQTFIVDKTAPTLNITGVKDESANNGAVIPVVAYADTNFDASKVSITLTGANRKNVELIGNYKAQHNGSVFTFDDFAEEKEIDDIYTLTATLTDKAGNSTKKTIMFSVNRFGSTYVYGKDTEKLNGTYVSKPIDAVITEVNPNALDDIKLTLFKNNNTIVLEEGKDYRIDVSGGNGGWYMYTYTVFATGFADDAVYRLTLHSEDKAGNIAENTLDTKKTEISFGVDKTLPTINVKNLESGITYAVDSMTVEMSVSDNLKLTGVTVYLDDYNNVYHSWNGDDLVNMIDEGGNFTFDISGDSTSAHKVKVVAVDAAGNEYTEELTGFFVTTNLFVRYYNNKLLFFGSIGGVVLIAGAAIALVVWKRKKALVKTH